MNKFMRRFGWGHARPGRIAVAVAFCGATAILMGQGTIKISQLPPFTAFASTDLLSGVDVSDTSEAVTGTTKKMTLAQLYGTPANGDLIGWVNGVPTPIGTGDGLTLSGAAPYTLTAAGSRAIALLPIADPATPAAGSLWSSQETGGLAYGRGETSIQRLGGPVYAGDGHAAVANTTTPTSLFGGGTVRHGSRAIPAGTMRAGGVIVVSSSGHYSTAGTPTIAVTVKVGGTTVIAGTTPALPSGVADMPWVVGPISLHVGAGGASGTVRGRPAEGRFFAVSQSGAGSVSLAISQATPQSVVPIDWTASQLIDVQVAWSVAGTSNTIAMDATEIIVY
jgi:hypothetical protein